MHIFQRSSRVFLLVIEDREHHKDFEPVAKWLTENDTSALFVPKDGQFGFYHSGEVKTQIGLVELIFKQESDAVLFKMQWCDQDD